MEILKRHSINQSKLSRLSGYARITDDRLVTGSRLMARKVKKDILTQFLTKCVDILSERCVYSKLEKMQDTGFMAIGKDYNIHHSQLPRFIKKKPEFIQMKVIRCYNDIINYLLDFE